MSGIYIHIPFCKQACNYCNFHFSTTLTLKERLISALCQEIKLRSEYLSEKKLSSIYFGGGTPSLLSSEELDRIFATLSTHYTWDIDAEITLETNPDDLNPSKLKDLRSIGINRLSIGIQSFYEEDLRFMHRAHNVSQSHQCLIDSQAAGFEDMSIDLIYGCPTTSDLMWQQNLKMANDYGINHISAYCLTVEEKTALHHQIKAKKLPALDQQKAISQFDIVMNYLESQGYEHYEISNYAQKGKRAIHNTNYWKGIPYLGLGPSAHSFDIATRSWNIAHNALYIKDIENGILPLESEKIDQTTRYNEYVMTSLRTIWGVAHDKIDSFDREIVHYFKTNIVRFIDEGMILDTNDCYILTTKGKYYADKIAMELFWVE